MINIQVVGAAATVTAIKKMADPHDMEKLVQKTALRIEAEAKKLCPVDTGRLRASIATQRLGPATYGVGTGVEYAPYVEFGTRKMSAQPFLRPAANKVKETMGSGLSFIF